MTSIGVSEKSTVGNEQIIRSKHSKKARSFRKLRLSLKYRPDVYKLILKLRHCIYNKNRLVCKLRRELHLKKNVKTTDTASQTEDNNDTSKLTTTKGENTSCTSQATAWSVGGNGGNGKSIADQVKEAAQSALGESGTVFVESMGMYYDYKTGYYYNSELGLYYHSDTGCYYYYSDDQKTFVFHSYPDASKGYEALKKHEMRKAKKHKQGKEDSSDQARKSKKMKMKLAKDETSKLSMKSKKKTNSHKKGKEAENKVIIKSENGRAIDDDGIPTVKDSTYEKIIDASDKTAVDKINKKKQDTDEMLVDADSKSKGERDYEMEDGECSDTESEPEEDQGEENEEDIKSSTSSSSDDDMVAKHHPPCMRIIVRETSLPKLKIGSLFLITKDGGTIGREGDHHTILLRDENVSRNHLDIRYDSGKGMYVAMDLGSKNGTVLNGTRMANSQVVSKPTEVPHGSTLELGETKLLCHIHSGNDTCGHCEPGLIMAADDKEKKVAYTRTCDVQTQHQLELARLKNKYAPEPLAIEDGSYNDRAKARREAVGSTHDAEKTKQADLDTCIEPENKGFQLLKKMGWSKGEGLGKDKQGDTEPIPLVSNESKAGLGAAGSAAPVAVGAIGSVPLRMTKKVRNLRPPAKLFRDPLEEDDD